MDSKNIKLLEESQKNILSNHWLNCILIENNKNFCREDIIIQLEKENIETKPLWLSLHLQPIFKGYPYYGDTFNLQLFNKGFF